MAALLLLPTFASAASLEPAGRTGGTVEDDNPQGCGGLAPFLKSCSDPRPEPYHSSAEPEYSFLGYVGRIEITAVQRIPGLPELRKEWGCDLFLMNAPGPVFTPADGCRMQPPRMTPAVFPDLVPGQLVTVECRTKAYLYHGTPATVGQWGPWGCKLKMPT